MLGFKNKEGSTNSLLSWASIEEENSTFLLNTFK